MSNLKVKLSIQMYKDGKYVWDTKEVSTSNPHLVCEALNASQILFDPWDEGDSETANVAVQATSPDGRTREVGGTHFVTLDGLRAVLNKFK